MIRVPGAGPAHASIMIVGDVPDIKAEIERAPFAGTIGYTLTNILHDAGINMQETYRTLTVKYRLNCDLSDLIKRKPTHKKVKVPEGFLPFKDKVVDPSIIANIRELEQEILAVRPNVVVTVGNTATWALTGYDSVDKWRGSVLKTHIQGQPIKVIPTFHPEFINRMYESRWDMVQDLRRAKKESVTPYVYEPGYRFTIRPSYTQVIDFLRWLHSETEKRPFKIICDIETRRKQIACYGIGWSKTDAFCIPIMSVTGHEGSYFSLEEELEIINRTKQIFHHPNARIMNQNMSYDAFYWARLWHMFPECAGDTMIQQHVLFPGKEKTLHYLASMHCEHYKYWKDDGKEWNARQLGEEVLWKYNCLDCVYTYEIEDSLQNALNVTGLSPQYQEQLGLFTPVLTSMLRGVRIIPEKREEFSREVLERIKKRERDLEFVFGHPVNPRSPKQLDKLLYKDLKMKPKVSRSTHKQTTNAKALEELMKENPIIAEPLRWLWDAKSLGVYRSTFIEAPGPKDRFFTAFNIAGAKTFRFKSSSNPMYEGTNGQNIPRSGENSLCPKCKSPDDVIQRNIDATCKTCAYTWEFKPDVKKMFVPDPGYAFIENDLARADLQVVIWEANDEDLKAKLRANADLHKENGKDAGLERQKAKMFIHLTNYGGSAKTAAQATGLTVHEAEVAQQKWFRAHPGIKDWHNRVYDSIMTTRSVRNKFGYRIFFFERLDNILKEALAWIPQSTVAIITNKVFKELSKYDPELQVLLQVHDSLLSQVRADLVAKYVPIINDTFNAQVVPYDDPLVIPCGFKIGREGVSWSECEEYEKEELALV